MARTAHINIGYPALHHCALPAALFYGGVAKHRIDSRTCALPHQSMALRVRLRENLHLGSRAGAAVAMFIGICETLAHKASRAAGNGDTRRTVRCAEAVLA